MLKFHVQEYERCANYILPACSLAAGRHIDQTFGVLDVRGVGLRHLTGDVKRMLTRVMSVDQDNFPEMMGHTCIINAPGVFKAIWAFIKPMLDARTQAKVEVCPRDFGPALLRWVAPENLPEYLGGQSAATLLDDSGPWQVRRDLFLRSFLFFWGGARGREGWSREKKTKNSANGKRKKLTFMKIDSKNVRTPSCLPPSRPPRPRGKGGGTRAGTGGASPRKARKRRKGNGREGRAGDESSRSRGRRACPCP